MIKYILTHIRLFKRKFRREYQTHTFIWKSFRSFLLVSLFFLLLWPYIRPIFTNIIKVNPCGAEFTLVFISVGLFLFSTYIAIVRQKITFAFISSSVLFCGSVLLCLAFMDVPMWLCMIIFFIATLLINVLCQQLKPKKKTLSNLPTELLGRSRMFNRIHSVIRTRSNRDNNFEGYASGFVVAIYGEWGSGKTYFLNYLSERLSKCFTKEFYDDKLEVIYTAPYRICKVNLWEYSTPNEAWKGIASILTSTISGTPSGQHVSRLSSLCTSVMPSPYNGLLFLLTELFFSSDDKTDRNLVEMISRKIKLGQKVVIIFDDIERANCDIITGLLPLMEKLKRIEGLLILCAIAKSELVKKLKPIYDEESTFGYLMKVVDISFELPELTDATIQNKISHDLCEKYEDCKLLNIFFEKYKLEFRTPRQIERILDHLSSVERMYFNDVEVSESEEMLMGKQEEFCVFLIEIVRMFYQPVFSEALEMEGGMKWLASRSMYFSSPLISIDKDYSHRNKFIESYKITGAFIKHDGLLQEILKRIASYEYPIISRAIKKDYARRLALNDKESKQFVEIHQGAIFKNLDEMIIDFFRDKSSAPEYIPEAVACLFEYTINNIWSDYHTEFLFSLIGDYEKKKSMKKYKNYYSSLYINAEHIIRFINSCYHKHNRDIRGKILNAYKLLLRETDMRDHYKALCHCFSLNEHKEEYIEHGSLKKHHETLQEPCIIVCLHLCIYYTMKLIALILNKSEQFFINEYLLLNVFLFDSNFTYSRCFRYAIKISAEKIEFSEGNTLNFLKYMTIRQDIQGLPDVTKQLAFCNKIFIMQPLFTKLRPYMRDDVETHNLVQDLKRMCEEALENCNTQKKFQNAVHETLKMLTSISVNTATTEQCRNSS